MRKLKIDPEFRDKVPPLTEDERKTLEENILKDGRVLVPLIAWNGIIIDGHNRYAIVQKHPEIPYDVVDREFVDRYEAIVWICRNQLGRRNLTDEQKTYLIGKQFEAQKMTVGNSTGNNQYKKQEIDQSGPIPNGTAGKIAKEHNVGVQTVKRAEKFARGVDEGEKVSKGFKDKILSGQISASKTVVSQIPAMPKEDRKKLIAQLEKGEYKKHVVPVRKKEDGNLGYTKELRDIKGLVDSAVNGLYDTERDVKYTANDVEQEIKMLCEDFLKKLNRSLQMRGAMLDDKELKEKIVSVLSETENNIKNIRSDLK